MQNTKYASKRVTYILMVILVFLWGLDFIAAKSAVGDVDAVTIIFLKYVPAFIILIVVKLIRSRKFNLRKKDIKYFLVCALFGDILYYTAEYMALDYLPVSIVSLVLAFVPAISIVTEIFLYKRLPTIAVVLGIIASAIGVGMIVGADYHELLSGKLIGYLFIFAALISWNIYNFMTERLTESYEPLELSMYQIGGALIFCAPYALTHMPQVEVVDAGFILSIAYLAIVSSVIGFIIYINAVAVIGVTPSALFSNMMPVTTTFFGWVLLGETITPMQFAGGMVVISAGATVIYLKDKNPGRYFGKKASSEKLNSGAVTVGIDGNGNDDSDG